MGVGADVFYVDGNVIQKSDVVATELREIGRESIVVLTLRSGKRVNKTDACYTLQDVLIQLKKEFELRAKIKADQHSVLGDLSVDAIRKLKEENQNTVTAP